MVLKMWSALLIVAATIYTGSCQCPVGAPLKICDVGKERPCPIGYYGDGSGINNICYCCRQACWGGAPITDNYGRVIECGPGQRGICPRPDTTTCTRTGYFGARSFCCPIMHTALSG
ncbi:scavenger receptor class F member 2-like isoform X1 [Dreissena polymorpha]|uniref:Uncharacterized protein n=1 Tax=Dreissena polymorpha TaxID=45954 RepID=A0A9D4C5T0_DREPO|nr:scavenger receptor class F member 2-like isoform X1 [Dreissena polymorpha]KAH3717631.1 hypothetical protein DPMN_060424 [Dreissena polymorpha]